MWCDVGKQPSSWENPLEKEKPGCAGRMQGLIAGHVSYSKRGHNLSCHTWLESLRSRITSTSGITQFEVHLPDENIKMARLV